MGAKTACIEFEGKGALTSLSSAKDGNEFHYEGVAYFPEVSAQDLGLIYSMDFEYMILDLGTDSRTARAELMRCNGKLIVGSLCPWKKAGYYDFMKRLQETTGYRDMFTFLALFEDKIEIKKCRRTIKAQVQSIPFIADPFHIKEKETEFLHTLI